VKSLRETSIEPYRDGPGKELEIFARVEMKEVIQALDEELATLGLDTYAESFVWLVLEVLVSQRKLLAQKVTRPLSAAEEKAYSAGGFDLRERSRQEAGPLERTMAKYAALIADALSIREAARLLALHPATIQRRLHRRSLYGLRLRGRWLLPRFQFDGEKVLLGLEDVLPAISPEIHPVAVSQFFVTPQDDLVVDELPGPLSPREWLATGQHPDRVAALARQLAMV
jgi:excisionase family DNA binding protein